jgi:hypothetical protein
MQPQAFRTEAYKGAATKRADRGFQKCGDRVGGGGHYEMECKGLLQTLQEENAEIF